MDSSPAAAGAAEGRFGGGLRLQPGDTVTIPDFPHATPDWTVSVWIKLSAADRAAFTTERAVLLTAEKASMGGWEIEFDPRPGFDWLEASYYVAPPTNDYVVLDCKCIEIDRWMHWTAVFDSTNHRFGLYHGVRLADSSSLPAPILPGDPDLNIGRWHLGGRADLRRDRRLRDLVPRAQRGRGRSDRFASRARRALTLRAGAGTKKLGLLCWADGSSCAALCSEHRAGGGAWVYGPDRQRAQAAGGHGGERHGRRAGARVGAGWYRPRRRRCPGDRRRRRDGRGRAVCALAAYPAPAVALVGRRNGATPYAIC